ncbi:hypothetical protein ACYZTM_23205 [Pseudomonas sp. MDT2-39-1]
MAAFGAANQTGGGQVDPTFTEQVRHLISEADHPPVRNALDVEGR